MDDFKNHPLEAANDSPLLADQSITNGWHTVFAIRYDKVNDAIRNQGASPTEPYSESSTGSGRTVAINGSFGHWQMAAGGDGRNARMSIPTPALTYSDTNLAADKVFPNVSFIVTVELDFLPQPPEETKKARKAGAISDAVQPMQLRLKPGTFGRQRIQSQGLGQIMVAEVQYTPGPGDPDMTAAERTIIGGLMTDYLDDHPGAFTHVFATVNLSTKIDEEDSAFEWVKPTYVSYAVADAGSVETGVFGILCMTGNVSASGLAHQINTDAIPEGKDGAYLISKERFLTNMVLPGVGDLFSEPEGEQGNWPQDYFDVTANGTQIVNTRPVHIAEMDFSKNEDGSKCYRADVPARKFSITLNDTYLNIKYDDLYHPYRNVTFWYNVHHDFSVDSTIGLSESGSIDLSPRVGAQDDDFLVHNVVVKPTNFTRWVEIGMLAASLFGAAYALKNTRWAVVKDAALAERGSTLAGVARASANVPTQAEMTALNIQAAQQQLSFVQKGTLLAKAWGSAALGAVRANLLVRICGGFFTLSKILQLGAHIDSQSELPKFDEFANRVMAPITWTGADDFVLDSVAFNKGLQIVGTPTFGEEKGEG